MARVGINTEPVVRPSDRPALICGRPKDFRPSSAFSEGLQSWTSHPAWWLTRCPPQVQSEPGSGEQADAPFRLSAPFMAKQAIQ